MDLIGTVVECLKCLGVKQTHQKIETLVIVWDNGIKGAFPLSKGIEVHIVMVGDGLDLGQVERRQTDSGGHENAFRCFARDKLSRTF